MELCDIFMKLVAAPAATHQCYVNGSVVKCKGVAGTRRESLVVYPLSILFKL